MGERLAKFRERYGPRISITVIALCWAAFIVGSQVNLVQAAFINSGAVQLVILTVLLDMSISRQKTPRASVVRVAGRDSEGANSIITAVENKAISNADMLEFSGVGAEPLIHDLALRGCRIRLLVKHPESVGAFQTRRIVANLEALFGRDYSDRVQVRCYRFPSSLRGRRLGNEIIAVGWYTPFIENGNLARYEVMGHDNALIIIELGTPEGRHLERMFQGVFNDLWTASDTEDARVVVSRYGVTELPRAQGRGGAQETSGDTKVSPD